jgi:hypothetical protein
MIGGGFSKRGEHSYRYAEYGHTPLPLEYPGCMPYLFAMWSAMWLVNVIAGILKPCGVTGNGTHPAEILIAEANATRNVYDSVVYVGAGWD